MSRPQPVNHMPLHNLSTYAVCTQMTPCCITTQHSPTPAPLLSLTPGGHSGRYDERDIVSASLRTTFPSLFFSVISTSGKQGMFRCSVIYIGGYSSLGADMPSKYLPLAPHARETFRICMACPHTHPSNMLLLVPLRLVGSCDIESAG